MAGDDTRISGSGYICGVWVDTKNPDVVYSFGTAAYKSTDGGETFTPFKGAPGGEDMHDIWIDPTDGKRMLFGVDQGAAITFDGGAILEQLLRLAGRPVLSHLHRQPVSLLGHGLRSRILALS